MFIKCVTCEGKGFFKFKGINMNVECESCGGKGGHEIPSGKILCKKCLGRGSELVVIPFGQPYELTCSQCGGRGYIG